MSTELHPDLQKFCLDLIHWLDANHDIVGRIGEIKSPTEVEMQLLIEGVDAGEDEEGLTGFYVGCSGWSGLRIRWIGELPLPEQFRIDYPRQFVECNSIIFESIARSVAGWVVGVE